MKEKMLKQVIAKIKPTQKEQEKQQKIATKLIEKIQKIEGSHTKVILSGSMARNTHLRNDNDIDIFVLFPKHLSKQELEKESMKISKKALKGNTIEIAYSEHPYVRANIEGYDIEVVPSYQITNTKEKKSAVDRTPFHNAYLQEKLNKKQKDEIRLLKQFLKTIKAYGADLKAESFPGYLTELLILRYENFQGLIKAANKWKKNEVIDLEKFYTKEQAIEKFKTPLIVIDPTDKTRNVASALSFNQFSRFISATRNFLKKPTKNYFFGKKFSPMKKAKAKQIMQKKHFIAIQMTYPKLHSDFVWGGMKKLSRKINNQLEHFDFQPTRIDFWTDEKKHIILIIELESKTISQIKKHFGPEVCDETNSTKFFNTNKKFFGGPRIEQGKWIIEKQRKYYHAKTLIKDFLTKEKTTAKTAIKKALNKKPTILEEKQLLNFYSKNKEFASYFSEYLKAREEFLDY